MQRTWRRVSAAAVGALTALSLSTAPSAAAPGDYLITNGGMFFAGSPYADFRIRTADTTKMDMLFGCTGGSANPNTAAGTIANGPVTYRLATITSTAWKNCIYPGGLNMEVIQDGTWDVVGTGPASSASNDLVSGYVENVRAIVKDTDFGGAACEFVVEGRANGAYQESATVAGQELRINETAGNLVITEIDPKGTGALCLGMYDVGDTVDLHATYRVVTAQPVQIDRVP